MDALLQWKFWTLSGIFVCTLYVQFVGNQVEKLTGVERVSNLVFYRRLFGGPPWLPWLFFRFGGIIQVACATAMFLLFGWKVGMSVIAAVPVFCLLAWRIARAHATQILAEIAGRPDTGSTAGLGGNQKP